jgi:hypothetical protein
MPDNPIGFKVSIDPSSKRTMMSDIGDIKSAMSDLLKDLLKSGDESLKTFSEVLKTVKETRKEGGDTAEAIHRIVEEFGKTSENIKPILAYLEEMDKKGIKITEVIGNMSSQFREVSKAAKESSEMMESMLKAGGGFSGLGLDKVLKEAGSGLKDVGMGVAELFNPLTLTKGIGDIFSGVEKLRASSEALRMAWNDLNRSAIDINATLGETGGILSHDLLDIAGKLGAEFVMMPDKVMAIEKGLANVGVHTKDLEKTTKDILTEFTAWTELTPEKQVALMGDLMSKFGMGATDAKNSMIAIFASSRDVVEKLKDSNVSMKVFQDAALGLEQSARQIGYNFGDATQMLSAMVGLTKDVKGNVDMASAAQITRGMMGIGTTDIGMQAYMMGQFGKIGGGALEQAGAFIGTQGEINEGRGGDATKRRIGAQVDFASMMLGATKPTSEAGMLGGVELINQKLNLGLDVVSQRKLAHEAFGEGEGLESLKKVMVGAAEKAEKERETNEKAAQELARSGATTDTILSETKTIEQRMAADIAGILARTGDIVTALLHPDQARAMEKTKAEVKALQEIYVPGAGGRGAADIRGKLMHGISEIDKSSGLRREGDKDFTPEEVEMARWTPKMDISRLSGEQKRQQGRMQFILTAVPEGHAQNDAPGRSG